MRVDDIRCIVGLGPIGEVGEVGEEGRVFKVFVLGEPGEVVGVGEALEEF
jgi:hypothetical protein